MPKEMLPIIDKPVIQYVVEEAVASGIQDVIMITGWQKRAIEDHFDRQFELEKHLEAQGKEKELLLIKKIAQLANFIYIRQKSEHYGNAMAVLAAKPVVGNEDFAVMWGDEFIMAKPPRLAQIMEVYKKYRGAVISAVAIDSEDQLSRYGIAEMEKVERNIFRIKKIVEKPKPQEAPSNLATHGAYILPPEIFDIISDLKPGKGGEMWLVEAINQLIQTDYPVYGCIIENGKYYDNGNKTEYLKTVIEFALNHPDFSKDIKEYLKSLKLD
jgi:UTP--glucose-1-phosphate uridylyltransferase